MRYFISTLLITALLLFVVTGPALACNLYGGDSFAVCTLSIDPPAPDVPVMTSNEFILLDPANAAGTASDQVLVGTLYAVMLSAEERGGVLYACSICPMLSDPSAYSNLYDADKGLSLHENPGRVALI